MTTEQDGNFGPIVAVWRLREVALRGTWETTPKQLRKVDVNKKASVKVNKICHFSFPCFGRTPSSLNASSASKQRVLAKQVPSPPAVANITPGTHPPPPPLHLAAREEANFYQGRSGERGHDGGGTCYCVPAAVAL